MKGFKLLIIILWIGISIFATLFGIEFKKNRHLVKEKKEISKEIEKANVSKRRLTTLERELKFLYEKLKSVSKKIPQDERELLEFLKKLSIIGEAIGLNNLEFTYRKGSAPPKNTESSPYSSSAPSSNLQPIYIEATFECEYPRLVYFLKKIYEAEELVVVDKVSVERDKNILPQQKIKLKLTIYTFR